MTDLASTILREQIEVLKRQGSSEDLGGRAGSVARVVRNALRHAGRPELADRVDAVMPAVGAQQSVEPLALVLDDIEQALNDMSGSVTPS